MVEVRDTSIEAYVDITLTGTVKTQKHMLFSILYKKYPNGVTRRELEDYLKNDHYKWRSSSLTSRIKNLIDDGILEDQNIRTCKVTGRNAHIVKIKYQFNDLMTGTG